MWETLHKTQEQTIGMAGRDILRFNTSVIGSSHKVSEKPCQDYTMVYEVDGNHIAIVCDGHGGKSYVRSDVGAKLAAESALKGILEFINPDTKALFDGKEGSVTAVPTKNLLKDEKGNKVEFDSLSECQQEIVRQNKSYLLDSNENPEVEVSFRNLFTNIVELWKEAIRKDSEENKFSIEETENLSGRSLEKAYGTTLMAAIWTPYYWFAFQIGDGKLLMCDEFIKWSEPVPWDYNCFLNVTTSLCDEDPIKEFRYAFNGKKQFPTAFVLGSDGIDDTFVEQDLIQRFYSNILILLADDNSKEKVLDYLKKQLPILSERGSRDDMSVAAIVATTHLDLSIKYYRSLTDAKSLKSEQMNKENNLKALESEINQLQDSYDTSFNRYKELKDEVNKQRLIFEEKSRKDKEEIENQKRIYKDKEKSLNELTKQLNEEKDKFNEWSEQGKSRYNSLKKEAEEIRSLLISERNKKDIDTTFS